MRHFLTIFALTTLGFSSFGQEQSIDTFISKINNQQIVVMMQYVWYPKMFSPAGDSLIQIGKPATDKLIPLLSDISKGIIAHFILSNIWRKELGKAGQTLGSNVHQVDNDTAAVLGILYTDFIFYQDNNRHIFSRQAYLESNRERWKTFFKTNTFRQQQPIGSR